jgi:hypothetical protein
MADIMGGLPEGLQAIQKEFGDQVVLIVRDARDRSKIKDYTGWDKLPLLESEGKRHDIYTRLEEQLSALERSGAISLDAARQARGDAPFAELSYVDGKKVERDGRDGLERGRTPGSGQAPVIEAGGLRVPARQVEPLTAQERFDAIQDMREIKLLREEMVAKLSRVVKSPKEVADKIDAVMASAVGNEVSAAKTVLDLKQGMAGLRRLLDFAGRKERERALFNEPGALQSVERYANSVQSEGKKIDSAIIHLAADTIQMC